MNKTNIQTGNLTYICIHCNKYVKNVDQKDAQKFLNKHNKTTWTGVRNSRLCVTDLITNELLEQKLALNERRHPNDKLVEESI